MVLQQGYRPNFVPSAVSFIVYQITQTSYHCLPMKLCICTEHLQARTRLKRNIPCFSVFFLNIVCRSLTFDFIGQITYSLIDKHINEQPFLSLSKTSIYYLNDFIINMIFESKSHVLIFLTSNKELRALSCLINFHHLVHIDVAWFKYSHRQILCIFLSRLICL
ncbi:hypothetical protein RF11_09230 [Thelohanellus kitauei]|uniref:Uncharacterized protein n=1 Tax=Thelohanellus kitauei TaxID=669202 RepID=A0A0C2MV46_THEKT|nr:hypothetical protein RF11_09230 [Thelohanellus kitauei]